MLSKKTTVDYGHCSYLGILVRHQNKNELSILAGTETSSRHELDASARVVTSKNEDGREWKWVCLCTYGCITNGTENCNLGLYMMLIYFCSLSVVKLKFETQPTSNIIISEGSNASLPCYAKSTGGHVIYDWFINGSLLSTSSNHSYRYITNDYGLVIVNVQRHIDDGLYRCIATNDLGSILSNQALLQVACELIDS